MCEVRLLPAVWIAAQRELERTESQLAILSDTLERMVAAGASDAVIEQLLTAIDLVDGSAAPAPADTVDELEPSDDVDDVDEYDEIDTGDESGDDRATRREVIARLRSEGYAGAGFDVLVTAYHRDLAEDEYLRAERDCRGQLVRSEFQLDYSARKFWFCSPRELRKYASEDLLRWFDQYGRLTRSQLRDNLMGRRHYAGSGYYCA